MIQTSPIIGGYKMVPSGVEIDKPLPRRAPFILYFTISNTIPPTFWSR
jgi:hypothetical protein